MPIFTALRVCCARAMSGQTADTPTAPMKSRRRKCPPEGQVSTVVAIVTGLRQTASCEGQLRIEIRLPRNDVCTFTTLPATKQTADHSRKSSGSAGLPSGSFCTRSHAPASNPCTACTAQARGSVSPRPADYIERNGLVTRDTELRDRDTRRCEAYRASWVWIGPPHRRPPRKPMLMPPDDSAECTGGRLGWQPLGQCRETVSDS